MDIKLIKTEEQYQAALNRIEKLFNAKPNTPQGDELELMLLVVDHYENQKFPIDPPDPIDAILFRMEQLGLKRKDLYGILGYKSRVSEILNKKRKLTLQMIRDLHKQLNIPTEILIREY